VNTNYPITRIKSDINGNPRRVIHFLAFITASDQHVQKVGQFSTSWLYDLALARAKRLGGKKYHNKSYGGGIVFQAYNDAEVYDIVERAKYNI